MGWKRKERELDAAEAIALAKTELEPYWHNSDPLISGVQNQSAWQVVPLDKSFVEKRWIIFFIDPISLTGESSLRYTRELFQRYQAHNLSFLIILRRTYQFLKGRQDAEELRRRFPINCPWTLDMDLHLAHAFGVESYPKCLVLDQGKVALQSEGPIWSGQFENALQTFIRKTDVGLPLLRATDRSAEFEKARIQLELGRSGSPLMNTPGFKPPVNGYGIGQFQDPLPELLESGRLYLQGQWMQHDEFIATTDPKATLTLQFEGAQISLVAQSVGTEYPESMMAFELDRAPSYESALGKDAFVLNDGMSAIELQAPQLYRVLKELPDGLHTIKLGLHPEARPKSALALYSLQLT